MKLTREFIDIIAPWHDRTSCHDDAAINGKFDINEELLRGIPVSRAFERYPRCHRCFLLDALWYHAGEVDPRIELNVRVELKLIQPEFEITAKNNVPTGD